jgi:type II restriction enzyme
MAKLKPYKRILNLNSVDELAKLFVDTLVPTNMTYEYFVNWEKVKKRVNKFNVEINILNSLIGSQNITEDFSKLLAQYPETLSVIPLIIAIRTNRFEILDSPDKTRSFSLKKKRVLATEEIANITYFCKKTGILALFSDVKLKNLRDYLLGVEVGMDTNARKNRSGTAMESLVYPMIAILREQFEDLEIIPQKKFQYIAKNYAADVPLALSDRKFDFALKHRNRFINVEVNFYSGGGSKPQEIVDSYINRQNELKTAQWVFIWITDGPGWRTGVNQIKVGFEKIDYLLNLNFLKKGILKEILTDL